MRFHDRVKRTYDRAKSDTRYGDAVSFKAACLTNIATAAEADAGIDRLRLALKAIAGEVPWPDPEMGFKDLAISTLYE